ncbi:MAG: hypothetical protein NZM13_06620 [Cyclobacteriaceae bacterium]|nr:hypothetical protein [Cyclobacteriaceae bacterium]MDW8331799.1 hypothetical protein [Cyclobacteriaceae bacterium]
MKFLKTLLLLLPLLSFSAGAQGIVNRLKQKALEAGEKALEKKVDPTPNTGNTGNNPSSGNTSDRPANTSGGGLVTTPPDVRQNIADAESAFRGGRYSDARYAVRQAMLGVEMEIGQKVLKSLPEAVQSLRFKPEADRVTSTGYGWVGLTIHREYGSGNKYFAVDIANNSALVAGVNAYLASGAYAQQTSGEQNWKQTKFKGYRAVIEYNQSSGYKLSVPFGQTSVIVFEGRNFSSEQEMMNAANVFDLDAIKTKLGEK